MALISPIRLGGFGLYPGPGTNEKLYPGEVTGRIFHPHHADQVEDFF
jgi:hypothetical protein